MSLGLGLLFILLIRRYDLWEPEPLFKVVAVGFLGGVVAVCLSSLAYGIVGHYIVKIQEVALHSFLIIGPIEEASKLLAYIALYYTVFKKKVDEPVDAIVYLSAIALGFSFIENILYAFKGGTVVLVYRYVIASPAHILFAIPMAIPLYLVLNKSQNRIVILPAWLIAAGLHGLWDALAFNKVIIIVFAAILIVMYRYANARLTDGLLASPFYPDIPAFFGKGKSGRKKKVWCIECHKQSALPAVRNDKLTYFKCPDCGGIIVDRNNAFKLIHYFFATFANLNKEYRRSCSYPDLHTIRNCVNVDDTFRFGLVDLPELISQTSELRTAARVECREDAGQQTASEKG
jgi:RsiW-degrading membrane proteinase PrsW (M82 family)/predicted RNA-binding Zn-ribbon protein involved in translation (DUF1610 family)